MITKEQYDAAVAQKQVAETIINQYHHEQAEAFDDRMANNPIFTDDELISHPIMGGVLTWNSPLRNPPSIFKFPLNIGNLRTLRIIYVRC